jgi:lysophospholipase L1-like esterase
MPRPSGTVLLRRLLLAILIAVAFFAGLEGLTRLLWDGPEVEGRMPADPRLRWGLPPGGEMVVEGVANRINSRGYRGPEFEVERSPCTLRIYSAGDSSAFGHGIPDGEAFVDQLPGRLAARGVTDLRIEPVNGAVPGYSTYQSLERLDQDGWALQPDLLLISNVWSDAGPAEVPDEEFYETDPGPRQRFPGAPDPPSRHYLRFVEWSRERLSPPRPTHADPGDGGGYRRVSSERYQANLRRLVEAARERGAAPLLLVLPLSSDRDDRMAGSAAGGSAAPADSRRPDDEDYRDRMRQVAAERNVPLVDLVPVFIEAGGEALFLDDLHPNAAGHALIADVVADAVVSGPDLLTPARARCAASVPVSP